ncbi:MAG: hypothetical protein SFV54_01945 [Bryobacteraceae bacterium]|nr:hypothetical protein [Bryobacteraceae bacterium]
MGVRDRNRFTTHRVRADAFRARTAYPSRESYPEDLARRQRQELPHWTEVGPLNSGGRLTAILVDPRQPKRIIVGSAAGGVYVSHNYGRQWTYCWDDQEQTLNIGSLAFDPSNPDRVYAGTGEANLSGDNYPGVGLFRLEPGAAGWTQVADTRIHFKQPRPNFGMFPFGGLPRRIGTIAVDPFDSNHVFVGGVTHSGEQGAGLFETFDGGGHWETARDRNQKKLASLISLHKPDGAPPFISSLGYFCHSVVFHRKHQGVAMAAVEAQGTQSGIWITRDGGDSWTQCTAGLPPGDQWGRTTLAIAGSTDVVYALVGRPRTGGLLGVFRSENLGQEWTPLAVPEEFAAGGQFSYNNCLAAHPTRPGIVAVGGVDLFVTLDGGETWRQATNGDPRKSSSTNHVHHDHHDVAIVGNRIYSANDGGFAISNDLGQTWDTRNEGLSLAMLYDLDVSPVSEESLSFGCQDLGIWLRGPLEPRAPKRDRVLRREWRGDGGWTCYHPTDQFHLYASLQRMELFRYRLEDQQWKRCKLAVSQREARSVWMAIIAMDRSDRTGDAPRAVYTGSKRVWRTTTATNSWKPVSPILDGSVITAIDVASSDPAFVYVGTENGGFFRSTDAGKTWSGNLSGPLSPGRLITRILSHPEDPRLVSYTLGTIAGQLELNEAGGFDAGQDVPLRFLRAGYENEADGKRTIQEFWHLYTSEDAGDTWGCDIATGMPNLPHNALAFLPNRVLVAANDGGVIYTTSGHHYRPLTGNLPNVRITDIVYHAKSKTLFAATYGRGVWSLPLSAVQEIIDQDNAGTSAPSPQR